MRHTSLLSRDVWFIPLYAGRRNHWLLGVIRPPKGNRPAILQYVDSDPLVSDNLVSQGSMWAFRVSSI